MFKFLRVALGDYRVGALTRSSRFVAGRVVRTLIPRYERIVEYGPGDGIITRAVLEKLSPTGRLLAVEMNPEFVRQLSTIHDPRLQVVHGNVLDVSKDFGSFGMAQPQAVFSGIPFSFLSPAQRRQMVAQTYDALPAGGMFLVYQYSTLMLPYLREKFKTVHIQFEPLNFPPYFFLVAEK